MNRFLPLFHLSLLIFSMDIFANTLTPPTQASCEYTSRSLCRNCEDSVHILRNECATSVQRVWSRGRCSLGKHSPLSACTQGRRASSTNPGQRSPMSAFPADRVNRVIETLEPPRLTWRNTYRTSQLHNGTITWFIYVMDQKRDIQVRDN